MEGSYLVRFLLSCYGIALIAIPASTSTKDDDESSGRIVYDQRQSGKYNIHVSIKDVAIIEMDQNDFVDETINGEDYYYDENDLTIKPLPSWLTKPTTSSISTSSNFQQNDSSTQSIVTGLPQNSITIPLITRYPPNSTYSPNLIADLAATQSAQSTLAATITKPFSSTTKRPPSTSAKHSTKKTTNVVILTTSSTPSTIANITHTHMPSIGPLELKTRSKNPSPMHIEMEPVLHPKEHETYFPAVQNKPATTSTEEMLPPRSSKREDHDSKIYKFKVRRAHKQVMSPSGYPIPYRYRSYGQRRCRSGHFLDESGNCRVKRSSSFLRKLVSMLVSLPFNEPEDDDVAE